MGWDDGDYSGGSDTFNTVGSSYKSKSRKTKIPRFRPIVKRRRGKPSEFAEAMSGLTMGMLIIFPVLAMLCMAYPLGYLSTIAGIGLVTWIFSENWRGALLLSGVFLGFTLLGFVSIGFYMMLLG
ncbi:hypothetical protein ACIQ4Z_20160 [Peribacillus asahii]|uniref:hypothetical protein n=1 Tax=Peribacillus asahii TaxID=228899 RepID=UPI00381ACB3E